ncbi:pentapeptide repeat-containing protein [Sulfuricurvum sp.]|uniref:pentapeptide repeat-containing protein n=1 Tax=Sulfuricurvum sp. TaxID=2025608 RepID=UPI0025EF2892|nr:pentapeptide repeat-containing protein [Sulfuricurvum sp.]
MGIWYDKEAYELLKKCSDAKDLTEWNEYRKATNYSPINFRFVDLSNLYLQKAEFQNIDLRGAILYRTDFELANVSSVNRSSTLFNSVYTIFFIIGLGSAWTAEILGKLDAKFITTVLGGSVIIGFVLLLFVVAAFRNNKINPFMNLLLYFLYAFNLAIFGSMIGATERIGLRQTIKIIYEIINNMSLFISIISILFVSIVVVFTIFILKVDVFNITGYKSPIGLAKNPEKVIGIRLSDIQFESMKSKNIADELQIEASEIGKAIEASQNDTEKKKLVLRQEELAKKIEFFTKQELDSRIQQTRIQNVIYELQAPYIYINQTITKIEWHNRFYYGAIVVFIGIFIYAIAHGYVDQKMVTFSSLFRKETLPSFGSIFGVILFYGSPVLIGISLIIYLITQINKNIDKITELQEQERNIKQIASTIKAKAQVGMSDEEFVKETKNLIQKYQEGMMAGMFTKDKLSDKEDKSSSSTYREKMIANGMSKLLMQALKK